MNETQIEDWLTLMNINNYEIHEDLSVSVNNPVDIRDRKLTHIPIQFNHIKGGFDCSYNFLTTLKGSPYSVSGSFICKNNNLSSLEFAPGFIAFDFDFSGNKLRTLESFKSTVSGGIYADDNLLYSLKGLPRNIEEEFSCVNNQIKNYEGMPSSIGLDLYCDYSLLEDLNNLPDFVTYSIVIIDKENINKDLNFVFDDEGQAVFTLSELHSIRLKKSLEQSLCEKTITIKKQKL